jgi:uncharacterized membrane protein YsdA (DUF1294 family)
MHWVLVIWSTLNIVVFAYLSRKNKKENKKWEIGNALIMYTLLIGSILFLLGTLISILVGD